MSQLTLKEIYLKTISKIDEVPKTKWYYYRDLMNDHDFTRTETCSNRAFYKLWEIMKRYPTIVPSEKKHVRTCHLAEAPGSFVQVVQTIMDHPISVALSKPRLEGQHTPMFQKSLFKNRNVKLVYIDLLDNCEMDKFVERFSEFDLVTADGGIDEKCFEDKEPMHHQLLFKEAVTALKIQALGGSLVFKCFETFTETTIKVLALIVRHYTNYTIVKPTTSRPTNSERYLLCRGFKGIDPNAQLPKTLEDMILSTSVPQRTREYIEKHNERLVVNQMMSIERTLDVIHGKIWIDKNGRLKKKHESYVEFCKRFQLNQDD